MVATENFSPPDEDDRFTERPNPNARIFDHLPSTAIRKEFLEWVKNDGRPDKWRYHVHTKPPKDTVPTILEKFDIPDKLRASVGEAPCPICKLRGPKYFSGMLAWFPQEKCLRAIGRECGGEWFNKDAFYAALNRYDEAKKDEAAGDFLILNYANIPLARAFIAEARHTARAADQLRQKFRRAIGVGDAKKIYRLSDGNRLPLFEEGPMQVYENGLPKFDLEDNPITRMERINLEYRHVDGLGVLRDINSFAEVIMQRADHILADFSFMDDPDETIKQIVEWGPEGRIDAEEKIQLAWKDIEEALKVIAEARVFFERRNLERFADWGFDRRCPFPFFCDVQNNGDVRVGETSRKFVRLETALPEIQLWLPPLTSATDERDAA